ncbi:MAG: alanine--tRNA ligase-related protein [Eubacteriales bacterium]|nr:alanine--tRNA ligase-related protein [Eubacteriales bacterium]
MTEKLYYEDSHLFSFRATVLSCERLTDAEDGFAVVLDKTAFFPEGGGQMADTGSIGSAEVTDVREKDGIITHFVKEDLSEFVGSELPCVLNAEQRLRRMQNHSGEHIVSGIVHRDYGFDNVGFHMGTDCMTIDFDGELTWEQLTEVEQKANETVRTNVPIVTYFPDINELKNIQYRSKLDLTENVRLVEIKGIDVCACCAPHVSYTGEIGIIKILNCERHRGGVRIELVCGMDALDDFRLRQKSVTQISNMMSAKRNEIAGAVEKLLAERDQLRFRYSELEMKLVSVMAEQYEDTDGNIAIFAELSDDACRELVNKLVKKCTGIAAVFFTSGGSGFRYIMGSRTRDLRAESKAINASICGKGGGKPEMIMGSCQADRAAIENFFLGGLK